jgi:hypothetical protein
MAEYKFPLDELWKTINNNDDFDTFKRVFDSWMQHYFDWFSCSCVVRDLIENETRPKRMEMIIYVLSKTGYDYGHDYDGIPEPIRWARYKKDKQLEEMIKNLEPPKVPPKVLFKFD